MKVALAQTRDLGSYEANVEQALLLMEEAHGKGAQVICFPELQFTSFFPKYPGDKIPFITAEKIPGPTVKRFQEKARICSMVTILSLLERFNGGFYNCCPVIDSDGSLLGVSRMVHVPDIPGYHGQDYFTASNSSFRVYHTAYGEIGILPGFDCHFPEAARILAINGAQLILAPVASGQCHEAKLLGVGLTAAAFQNGIYAAMVNRTGREEGVDFPGGSMLVGPDGEQCCEADNTTGIIIGEVDWDKVAQERQKRPYLKLRRPDEYFNIIKLSVD